MLPKHKEEAGKRLKKVAGQVQGILKMLEEDRYCIDILNQISAVRAALDRVGLVILRGHMETCVTNAIKKENGDELIEELEEALKRFLR
jgi:DNA-binding FrmR family transcriptional regulator